jgi:hypothetical protein
MQQTEGTTMTTGGSYSDGVQKSAMDIHYYLDGGGDNFRVDQPAIQRQFETYFAAQIAQCADILKQAAAIDPIICKVIRLFKQRDGLLALN